ncbi:hypothetical protein [Alcanivorax sp. 1008]|uniref:hypothetical protein n=1 Tax=Alcanivorax sp. 1008 TaxID=2816853 RepID=UPI001DCE83A2|nr:hypothetical protein [Alcanivorax sp. 1008]MCC1496701.1 hypothetical protein [Alcanivorax sp. 1008]
MTANTSSLAHLKNLSKSVEAQRKGAKSNTGGGETIAMVIGGFDLSSEPQCAFGTDFFTGAPIRVFLRPDPNAASRRSPRYEMPNFLSGKGTAPAVQAGGTMLFKSCHQVSEGNGDQPKVYSAFWGEVLSYFPGQAHLRYLPTHVKIQPRRPSAPEEWQRNGVFTVSMLLNGPDQVITILPGDGNPAQERTTTMDQLPPLLGSWLDQSKIAYYRYVVLRATTVTGERLAFEARPLKKQDGIRPSGEESAEAFLSGEVGRSLVGAMSEGAISSIEMIAGMTISPGKNYQDRIMSSDHMISAYSQMYSTDINEAQVPVYVPTLVAIRQAENKAVFLTSVETPLGAKAPRYCLEDIPTPSFEGESQPTLAEIKHSNHDEKSSPAAARMEAPSL